MKKKQLAAILLCMSVLAAGCGAKDTTGVVSPAYPDAVQITLSDEAITVNGEAVTEDETAAVYTANDIVYYEVGKDFTYGEGTEADEHTREEADAHTVVHITQPGTYEVTGSLSAGQIAIDLGKEAEEDPESVVTLVLNNADITCTVAPAVIFYEVYECSSSDEEDATKDVDTQNAGANVIIADGSENNISGSYVARIYKSVDLSEDGTEVVDSKKLHKYDAAFYSKKSMNIDGGAEDTGVLNITAENEGLDSELHLTINGGNINIVSGNDGINTNEDYVSVTTVNDGILKIAVDGSTGEGDGIDSNGWLVINGGTVIAEACSFSGDAGIDSDMGIHINGGTVLATGNMLDHISESAQNYAVFEFAQTQKAGETYSLKNEAGKIVVSCTPQNDFSYLIISDAALADGTYTLWAGDAQLSGAAGAGGMGMMPMGGERPEGMEMPEGMEPPEGGKMPEGMELPEGMERPEGGKMPEGMERPEGGEMPERMERPEGGEMPEGMESPEGDGKRGGRRGQMGADTAPVSTEFEIAAGGSYFAGVGAAE